MEEYRELTEGYQCPECGSWDTFVNYDEIEHVEQDDYRVMAHCEQCDHDWYIDARLVEVL